MNENNGNDMREVDDKPKRLPPGRRLRAAREIAHISVVEAAGHLRLDPQLISALEEDKYTNLPGAAYVCGYLRAYARLLKLPENEIVQAYTQGEDIKAALIPENVNILPPKRTNRRLLRFGMLSVFMLVIAAGFLWVAEQLHLFEPKVASHTLAVPANTTLSPPPSEQVSPSDTQNIVPTEPAVVTPVADEPPVKPISKNSQELRLKYKADSWTEVKDAQGERLIFRLVEKDSELTLHGTPPLWVLLGYADGVEVYYRGKRFDTSSFIQNQVAIFTLGSS
ncbi:MAG: helix-turn-helix domain-containing protein [Gammaproteobacteria bacterium]|nr:helix-turn-helix domain-containing protein [Gammaproteobacteria bacterium]